MKYSEIITYWDWLLTPFYLLIILAIASHIKNRMIKNNPIYKYFLWGLFAKIIGALSLCLIYLYYYKTGGDTLNYHQTATSLVNLLSNNTSGFFDVWFGSNTPETYSNFTYETGFPSYWDDYNAFNVVRLIVPLELIGMKSYFITSILMATVSFTGIWKLYSLFCELFPNLYKEFAISVLFIPSVIFWGSGILKDSWTIAAAGWFSYSFYMLLIRRRKVFYYSVTIVISSLILIAIKPYIFIAIMPGCLIWSMWLRIVAINSIVFRLLFVPFILSIGMGAGLLLYSSVSSKLGEYSSLDNMIHKAYVSSEDLKQEYYKGNSFDIGSYEPTLAGLIYKFPIATITGLFRPFLWETKNIVMIFSGLENLFILGFTFFVLLRKPRSSLVNIFSNPLVLFCFIFAMFFAFSVAISTSNFGALVRLRIPMIPFLISGMVIINFLNNSKCRSDYTPLQRS